MAQRFACFTLDLEPDFSTENSHEVLLNPNRFSQFETFLLDNQIKLSVFVTGKMLNGKLPIREIFKTIAPEFELHSFSHNILQPDSEEEIMRGKAAYIQYFSHTPRGYRAPNGIISKEGLSILHREGFLYDASVFPAWRPELGYNFSNMPTDPWIYQEYPGFLELPFAVVPKVRLVVSMSFLKLFGFPFYVTMFSLFGFPSIIVFDSHLYDFFITSPVRNLPRYNWRKYALTRNINNTFLLLQKFIDFLISKGYQFITMGELYDEMIANKQVLSKVSAKGLSVNRVKNEGSVS